MYSSDLSSTTPVRSLPAGPGTKIPKLIDIAVSRTGEIFAADGMGVAVFSPTANGNDDPVRYILWSAPPTGEQQDWMNVAVDDADNLYVRSGTMIAVFGPKDTGAATPARIITGPQTQIASQSSHTWSMTVDAQGDIYLLGYTVRQDALNPFGVLVFGSDANGDVAPVRYVTTQGMSDGYYGDPTGVAVDKAGNLYVSASPPTDDFARLFIFPPGASGNTTPSRMVSMPNQFNLGDVLWVYNGGGIALLQ